MDDFIDYIDNKRSVAKVVLSVYDSMRRNEVSYFESVWKEVGGSKFTISNRIKELESHGFITRKVYSEVSNLVRVIELTTKGLQLAEILNELREIDFNDAHTGL